MTDQPTNRYQVAQQNELQDGELKAVKAGDTDLLLVRTGSHIAAFQANCPHKGAPLVKGILNGSRLMCPWHHACFSAQTGDLLEPPSLDALAHFEVMHEGDALFVTLPGGETPENPLPELATPDDADTRVFVIVGAGAAGTTAAQTLREDGFRGRVVLITQDDAAPYDRTMLSKGFLAGAADSKPLRDSSFYDKYGLELLESRTVSQVDPAAQQLTFEDGDTLHQDTLHYDALLLATGSTPVPLEVPGADLGGVFYLRTLQDAEQLVAAAEQGQRAVVVGSSFIGLECAASLRKRGLAVTVVTPQVVPFEGLFGTEVGAMFRNLHEDNGVEFASEQQVTRFLGDAQVEQVVLEDGRELPADLVVVGIGVKPTLPTIDGAELNEDGSVSVDAALRLIGEHGPVYAAGDHARYPDAVTGQPIRVEHWRLAMQHGRAAAHNMAGSENPFGDVAFFWTQQYGTSFRYVGHAENWDEVVLDGDVGAQEFLAYYLENGKLRAVFGVGRDTDLCAVEECLRLGTLPSADDLRDQNVNWTSLLASAATG